MREWELNKRASEQATERDKWSGSESESESLGVGVGVRGAEWE